MSERIWRLWVSLPPVNQLGQRMRALQPHHFRVALVCLVAAVVGAIPVEAGATVLPLGNTCVREPDDVMVRSAGDSGGEEGGAPPKPRSALYKQVVTLDVTVDGLEEGELPISIKEMCDVPTKLARSAAKLAGSDGIVLRLPRTTIWEDGALKTGPAATSLIDAADAAHMRGRFTRPRAWRTDGDGIRIATFRARRIEVTD